MPFIDLSHVEEREMAPGFRARFVHTDVLTLAFWRVRAGAVLPEHAHPHEQVTTLVRGRFEMIVDGKAVLLEEGAALVIPPNARHSGMPLTDCYIIDVFFPRREDFLAGR